MTRLMVLGVGNTVLSDEGVGVRLLEHLDRQGPPLPGVELVDGGTMGLSLLPLLEEADALVVADAALLDATPGTVRVFEGEAMDAFLRGRGRSPHDVGLDDLMDTLRLRERLPAQRALVAIQPQHLSLGNDLSPPVAAALPVAAARVAEIVAAWAANNTNSA